MTAFEIAASGMAAHRAEMDVIAQNIANAGAARADGGAPYRARRAVFEPAEGSPFASVLQAATTASIDVGPLDGGPPDVRPFDFSPLEVDEDSTPPTGVRLAGFVESESADGDVDPIEQMVSLVGAGRAYDADVAALQAAKQMDVEAIEVDRP